MTRTAKQQYQSKPLAVEAVQYDPPTGHDTGDGNIDDLEQFAGQALHRQAPWVPEQGQNCLLLTHDPQPVAHDVEGYPTSYRDVPPDVLMPGDYLVKAADGSLAIARQADFEAAWTAVEQPPTPTAREVLSANASGSTGTAETA